MSSESAPQENSPESLSKAERLTQLTSVFEIAETAISQERREEAKSHLPAIYGELFSLNHRVAGDPAIWIWNPDGDLTEEEFDILNRRRKLLSNAIGIMTKSGEIRHDLNKV